MLGHAIMMDERMVSIATMLGKLLLVLHAREFLLLAISVCAHALSKLKLELGLHLRRVIYSTHIVLRSDSSLGSEELSLVWS